MMAFLYMFVRGMQSVHLNINYYIFVQLVPMLYFLGVGFFFKMGCDEQSIASKPLDYDDTYL